MLRLANILKLWKEADSFSAHINLYGFWNDSAFLTKSGDLGMVLRVIGVDYESLDCNKQESAVKRLEAALKNFSPGFHVYQYLFKTNRPEIPFARYEHPVVQTGQERRQRHFEEKADQLFEIDIYYAIVIEGARSKTGFSAVFKQLAHNPAGGFNELKAQFSNRGMKVLLCTQIERDLARLEQQVQAFVCQLSDFVRIEVLDYRSQFRFLRRLLNYDDWRVAGEPKHSQFLCNQVVASTLECERNHLRVGEDYVRILTMKECIGETRPLALDALLKIPANFIAVSEWLPLPPVAARKEVNKRRRHFNVSKTGFVSQLGNDPSKTNPRDVLVDESKQADIENLGDCLRELGEGQQLGEFSLTILLYGKDQQAVDSVVAEFAGIFTKADGELSAETYNQLNAYFAILPGNYAFNLRRLYLLNTNYADLSFLFTILAGKKVNRYLGTEYRAVLETDNATPYYLNLHVNDVAHTLMLGATGSVKSYFANFILQNAQKLRSAYLHFRHRRQLRGADAHLRRIVSQYRPRGLRFHDQPVFSGAQPGEPAIPFQPAAGAD